MQVYFADVDRKPTGGGVAPGRPGGRFRPVEPECWNIPIPREGGCEQASPVMDTAMATADLWTPSRRLLSAARVESERIRHRLEDLARRREELGAELEQLDLTQDHLRRELQGLARFEGEAGETSSRVPDPRHLRAIVAEAGGDNGPELLRGAHIRVAAVQLMAAHLSETGAGIHYRDWYELFRSAGYEAAGKDPLATFLTQIGRSPVVKRSTESGVYALEPEFLDRAREQLARLRLALASTGDVEPQAPVEAIQRARQDRTALVAEIGGVERAVEEAQHSLTPAASRLLRRRA